MTVPVVRPRAHGASGTLGGSGATGTPSTSQMIFQKLIASGPAAAAILAGQGMAVIKIEPPSGDLTAHAMPPLYAQLNRAARIETVDLRARAGQARFRELLAGADVLISSHRRASLARLGITVAALAAVNPDLVWVEIVGDAEAPDVPGHDLTYQAQAGLLGEGMPRTLLADLAGAEAAAGATPTASSTSKPPRSPSCCAPWASPASPPTRPSPATSPRSPASTRS